MIMRCPHCKQQPAPPDRNARTYTLWANQYGREVRIFCDTCGFWTDNRELYGQKPMWRYVDKFTAPEGEHLNWRVGEHK